MNVLSQIFFWLIAALATAAIGVALGLAVMRSMRRSKQGAGLVVASALFLVRLSRRTTTGMGRGIARRD